MKNYITLQESIQEDIKNVGIFMAIVTVIISFQGVLASDPYYFFDVLAAGLMAYFAYFKASLKAVYFALAYYILDSVLYIDIYADSLVAVVVRIAILYWLAKTAFNGYRATNNPELTVQSG